MRFLCEVFNNHDQMMCNALTRELSTDLGMVAFFINVITCFSAYCHIYPNPLGGEVTINRHGLLPGFYFEHVDKIQLILVWNFNE